ncbi:MULTISPECIES: YjdJ family protein [Bacillus]|uniref:YjdJ family protein n=1 Tax=Bacillus TaxID=1386 RepID=UPI001C001A11|nr:MULTISPECIES: YjdJ family protein [Bacillus]MBT9250932.1 YjdJ family protein [Bacillus halotolerans]MCC8352455.1 YjdJ family protein [Bacillus sp. AF23]MEC1542726.1 YjdJ family protein [Bacillus halotolerans]
MKGIVLVVQLGFSFMAFLFLAAVNWYQGSELVSDQFDWNYTATFSKLLNGIDTITSPKQISQLDFFIYSAKHYPVISIVMICSFLYVLLSLFLLIRNCHTAR